MQLHEFHIGKKFFSRGGFEWLCTDKGTRTITAIMLEPKNSSIWLEGPPYFLNEEVFDEIDMKTCYFQFEDCISTSLCDLKNSSHPNFLSEDVFKMLREKLTNYPRKKIFRKDRVDSNGYIWHPYSAKRINDDWFILIFELFSREYSEMKEDEFIQLPYSTEESMKKRKDLFS